MADLRLSLACGAYDRTLALQDGSVKPDGIELTYIARQPAEIFWRMLQFQEFDVAEMSFANYAMLLSKGDCPFVGIPVYPSRNFRHGFVFINTASGIEKPADLNGRRGGVPEYSMTAAVYLRGMLQHEYGLRAESIEWSQSRPARIAHTLPGSIRLHQLPAGSELGELLEQGEIDFLLTADVPESFRRGSERVRRLFPNYRAVEQEYFRKTGIFPIMHLVVIRRALFDQHPWIMLSLYQAFQTAKLRCYHRLEETGALATSLAWLQAALEEERALFGPDHWSYGVESNRPSLQSMLDYLDEQGLLARPVAIEELFAPSTLRDIPLTDGYRH